ncbi:hypothetical protein ScPMuIL_010494 [Solemya velum]
MGETGFRSAGHVAIHARHLAIGHGTVISFTHDTSDLTSMLFPGIIVLEAFRTKVYGTEKSGDRRDGVEMIVVHQVEIDAGSFRMIGFGTREKFISQTGTHHEDSYAKSILESSDVSFLPDTSPMSVTSRQRQVPGISDQILLQCPYREM